MAAWLCTQSFSGSLNASLPDKLPTPAFTRSSHAYDAGICLTACGHVPAGASADLTATLINTGNVQLNGAAVVVNDVVLTCQTGTTVSTNLTDTYSNDASAALPYNSKAVCTGTYSFTQASYEALTAAYKPFIAQVQNATGWTVTPADNAADETHVSADVTAVIQATFDSSSCLKPKVLLVSSFGEPLRAQAEKCSTMMNAVHCPHALVHCVCFTPCCLAATVCLARMPQDAVRFVNFPCTAAPS